MASRAHRWKGDDTPLTGVHGGTKKAAERAIAASVQATRDALRYADWVARGKPPSPSLPPRKDRLRPSKARGGRDAMRLRLYHAQDGVCGLCQEPLTSAAVGTIDHVVPRALGGRNMGNRLLAHSLCNLSKSDRRPTETELEMLARVNARLAEPK